MTGILLRDVEIDGLPGLDLHMRDGLVCAIGTSLDPTGSTVVDGRGGAVIPGLTDHHLHLHSLAATTRSVRCGPPDVVTPSALANALRTAHADSTGWVRGVGYTESVAGELLSNVIDVMHADRPVRIQHRSGALWMLNSIAVSRLSLSSRDHPAIERGADGTPTGRIWRADSWLRELLPPTAPPDLRDVGVILARLGITSVTDATPNLADAALRSIVHAMQSGAVPQRVCLLGVENGSAAAPLVDGRLTHGPVKIVIADSALPDVDALTRRIAAAHSIGRAVAVHCVSIEAMVLLLLALETAGSMDGDRIEHASVVPAELLDRLRRSGVRVVTQPGFLADRGDDYVRDVDTRDLPGLYRCRSLVEASIPVALSSDAPYGPVDPWAVIASAAERRTRSGFVVGPTERIDTATALDAYLGPSDDPGGEPRRLTVGGPADIVVLDAPLTTVLDDPRADRVRATYIAGSLV